MLKYHSLLAFFAFTSSVLADEANICRITGNYGCQQYGYNCNDVIGDDNIEALQPTALFGALCPGTKSEDNLICCDTANLNGGYCPNLDEMERYGSLCLDSDRLSFTRWARDRRLLSDIRLEDRIIVSILFGCREG